jgi:hypothetical protein
MSGSAMMGASVMNAVAVEYLDERKGFWRLGYLEKSDLTWAWVRTVAGRTMRIPVAQTRGLQPTKQPPN